MLKTGTSSTTAEKKVSWRPNEKSDQDGKKINNAAKNGTTTTKF